MEVKDTVIKLNCGGMLSGTEVEYYNRGAEAQAEISFKAGREVGNSKGFKLGVIAGELLGRREVVEFMNRFYEGRLLSSSEVWQAKLKEWGIKSHETHQD